MTADIDSILREIEDFLREHQNPEIVRKYSRFFTEGYDAYGIDKDLLPLQQKEWSERYRDTLGHDGFLDLGDRLVMTGRYEAVILATLFMVPFKDSFTKETFRRTGSWLDEGISNWAETDVLCQHILSPMLSQDVVDIGDLVSWIGSPSRWKRRAIPVTMLALRDQPARYPSCFEIISPLMTDPERVVHQGLGWLLREMWKKNPGPVEEFLLSWRETAPRLIFQYATEKMEKEKRIQFRRSKKGSLVKGSSSRDR